jgi:calmodulin
MQKREAMMQFGEIDTDNSGSIDYEELVAWLEQNQQSAMLARIIFTIWDRGGKKEISERDYLQYYEAIEANGGGEQGLWEFAFHMIDSNGDGEITAAEIAEFAKLIDAPLTEDQAQELIAEMDIDGNGRLSFEELQTAFAKL